MILGFYHIPVVKFVVDRWKMIVGIIVCFFVILGHVHLVHNWLKLVAFVGPIKMYVDVGSKSSLVKHVVRKNWIVVFIDVLRFATAAIVRRVGRVVFIGVNVGRWKRRGSVVNVFFNVVILVRRSLAVGSMFVRKGVILGSVVDVLYKGRELVLVGKGCMKECLVMLLCRFVVQLVRKRCRVGIIGVMNDAIVVSVWRLVGLLWRKVVVVEALGKM
jgi:hypothetical protein